MFDIGWTELLLIGIVALIVVGPKDLPAMFRTLGRFTAKLRAMGREFQRAMDAAADESGVRDMANDLRKATNPKSMGLDALKDAADRFEKWDPAKPRTAQPKPAVSPAAAGAGAAGVTAESTGAASDGRATYTAALAEAQAAKRAERIAAADARRAARAAEAAQTGKPSE